MGADEIQIGVHKIRKIKRRIRFVSEVRLVKEYMYLGINGNHHVFEGRKWFYLVPVTHENFNKAEVGKSYGLSAKCRKNSIKQFKE